MRLTTTPVETLSAPFFLNMVKAGAQEIIVNEALINSLNVFPVTDHDTGSNMAALMRMILSQPYQTDDLSQMLKQIADASLLGACGNSGMIFSAFFVGIASNHFFQNELNKEAFLAAIKLGVKRAYQAVSDPVEGTILSVMSEWANYCTDAFKAHHDFKTVFADSVAHAQAVLDRTRSQLAVLEKHQVVDAGAYGFVQFLNGMQAYLVQPDKEIQFTQEQSTSLPEINVDHYHDGSSQYQFCMECLISSPNKDAAYLEQSLKDLGDSIVINRSASYLKVHIHANDLKKITHLLKNYGIIQHQKIDDMKKQWEIAKARKYKIALVTDSSADIPPEWIQQEQIHILPVQIRIGAHVLQDRLTIDLNTLDALKEDKVELGTSSPSAETVSRYLKFLSLNYDSIIIITLSAKMSSTYQLIANQANLLNETKITVIDSLKFSAAQGLLVMQAAKLIATGLSHDEIVDKVNQLRDDTHLYATIDETNTVNKSGRAPIAMRFLIDWLNLKPIVRTNKQGKTSLIAITMGRRLCWRKIASVLQQFKKHSKANSVGVIYTTSVEKATNFASYVKKKTGITIDFIQEASCSLALHAGRSYLGIAICGDSLS